MESAKNKISDIYIINSCTVTHKADRETRRLIRHFNKENPKAKIVVAGCYAELDEDRRSLCKIKGVTQLFRNNDKQDIALYLSQEYGLMGMDGPTPSPYSSGRNRAFLKIQDGCDNACAYCKVSLVRGPSVSKSKGDILNELNGLIRAGYREIVLTGICIGAWGRDHTRRSSLHDLLSDIIRIEGDYRIRISSIEYQYVTDELIGIIAGSEKLCDHLHIPLQSGDDRILKLMNRGYSRRDFSGLIEKLRKIIPNVGFTTDVMLGFPGENKESFDNTSRFIDLTAPSRVHIFTYSKRKGTKAFDLEGSINQSEIKAYKDKLEEHSERTAARFAKDLVGKDLELLVESSRDRKTGLLTGYTGNYVRVLMDGPGELCNKIIPINITGVTQRGVFAERSI